jgi:RecB family exonuclease
MPSAEKMLVSPRAVERLETASAWLEALASGAQALVVAANQEAADDLVRTLAIKRGALFAVSRMTLNRIVGLLAAPYLAEAGLTPAVGLAAEAVAARAVFRIRDDPRLAYFAPVLDRPGFPGALARTLVELRLAGVPVSQIEGLEIRGAALAALLERFESELREAKLIDRAGMLVAARDAIESGPASPLTGVPTLFLDLALESTGEGDLVAALAAKSPSVMVTIPAGDSRTQRLFAQALGLGVASAGASPPSPAAPSLARLQEYLFADAPPPTTPLDDSVTLRSAAGEMQECVEIARRIHTEAKRGVPFDRIAVLLHAPVRYGPYLEEALGRAGIPAWFARGTSRPEPGGRALLALLNCAAENFSARRFAEYLSLAQVPDNAATAVDSRSDDAAPFIAAASDLAAAVLRTDLELPRPTPQADPPDADPLPVVEGTVRAPWRWERLLVDATVVGGRDRWEQRLGGLAEELRLKHTELLDDEARADAIGRQLLDLDHLRAVAIPVIGALAAMPAASTWAEWLTHLRSLVQLAVRDREPVLAALAELEPMGPVGPITLDEVRIVLAERLGRLEARPARRRYGAVFVAPTSYVRGLDFDVTIIPGLAERCFPKKLTQDPILPDAMRRRLSPDLALQGERVAAERLALRLAAGAARTHTMFSYPRVDLDQARPRVPSFYALEILRAAEGRLPGFDELARRAAGERITRLGWPTPETPADAIDEVEFDLAVLDRLIDADPETTTGAAHYLLDVNPHLARALRARARRWLRRWTPNDGLVDPGARERAALAHHQLDARSYSPTALQNFAACPYRFFLQAILRLEPREEIEAIEVIDPLTRGALFHDVQFEVLTALRADQSLPLTPAGLDTAYGVLEEKLEGVAALYHEKLAPAIERVWLDGIDSIRADLREWMRRMADESGGFRPERFELAFGLSDRPKADPASVETPVALAEGIRIRGSIDLVERGPDGRLRVTDHKTGRVRANRDFIIGGGKTLQPVLYALAAERVLDQPVGSGRLYYCTAAGGYEERIAAIDQTARDSIAQLASILGAALGDGFLPAAPDTRECDYCDYRRICGPYEEIRVRLKTEADGVRTRLGGLTELRKMK